ncbi:MAG: hypothetical protein NY202_02475 [Mollicutes bacterium UO1]
MDEAFGTKTATTASELEKFIADSANEADKKSALTVAKKVKQQASDSKDCVETALEKLKDAPEEQLEAARNKLKTLLTGLKIGDQDAYEEVVKDIKDSLANINKAVEIWEKCQQIETATKDDDGKLLNEFNNLKNGNNEA